MLRKCSIKYSFIVCLVLSLVPLVRYMIKNDILKRVNSISVIETENDANVTILKSNCACRAENIKIKHVNNILSITRGTYSYQVDPKVVNFDSVTCDIYNVLRRGMGQKVIGLSLYGTDERYYKSFKIIAKQAQKFYPDWIIRVYYDKTINKSAICELECYQDTDGNIFDNIDFCNTNEMPYGNPSNKTWSADYMHAMKWRWFPIGDPFVDMFLSRDSDSWIHDREYQAVKQWFNASALFHIMRDHPFHTIPMLGGMWGYANYRNRKLGRDLFGLIINRQIASQFGSAGNSQKGRDQDFLGAHIWPHAQSNAIVHASFHCKSFGDNALPFPTQRPEGNCYATCSFCCDFKKYNENWPFDCPMECRPTNHQDWQFC